MMAVASSLQARPVTFKGPGAKRIFSAKPSTVVSRSAFVVRAYTVTLKTPEGEQKIECAGAVPALSANAHLSGRRAGALSPRRTLVSAAAAARGEAACAAGW